MMWLHKTCANSEKVCKQLFYKDKILIKNLDVRYYDDYIKKDIDK